VSRSLSRWQAVVLGLIVLSALVLGVVGLFAVGSRGWYSADALTLQAGFEQIGGVEVGTRVRLQGMDAGEIVAIQPPAEPGGAVVLQMRLKGEYRKLIRTDAKVRIVGEGLVGGKVVEVVPQKPKPGEKPAPGAENGTVLASQPTVEAGDLMEKFAAAMEGEGTLGMVLKDPRLYMATLAAVEQIKSTSASVQENSDRVQDSWVMHALGKTPRELLVRPDCQRDRRILTETELFVPGEATLTAQGKAALDSIAPWLNGMKHPGSEVVIVSYADSKAGRSAEVAKTTTAKQSEAAARYLRDQHGVHRMRWVTLGDLVGVRKVIPLGMGLNGPPEPEPKPLPPARVEVVVFVPQK
jgi:phospholipid/cholesterol/gamma-HCH transport system substrate-binding protein